MSLLVAWVVFPLLMSALSLGLCLLVEATVGVRFSGALVLPVGFATMVVVTGLTTMFSTTAQFTVAAVVALAAAGILLGFRRMRLPELWPAVSALAVFIVFAAPVVLSGDATFTGWIKLDDGATWLAFADRLVEAGRNTAGLAPSSYEVTLAHNLGNGYPVGAFVPLGTGGRLVPEDSAWLLQPYMAFGAALLALVLYDLVSRVVDRRELRALVAFVGAQGALYYGYALWGGVKEIIAAPLIALTAALAGLLLRKDASLRVTIPLAIAVAAVLDVQSVAGGTWLFPILLPALFLLVRGRGFGFALRASGVFAAAAIVLSAPALAVGATWVEELRASSVATGADVLGNLYAPLKLAQGMGIWPAGDFRVNPVGLGPTYVLIGVAVVAAIAGLVHCVRRQTPELPLFVAACVISAVALTQLSSPWIGGKALATAAPALLATAMVGACWLIQSGRRIEGLVVGIALAGGVLWSNVLQYHDVLLAPRAQLAELEAIGDDYAGQGPALMTEYSPYGVRHFLRTLDGEGAGEFRRHLIPLLDGRSLDKAADANIDDFQTEPLLYFRTLVLRRSATESRPPSPYQRVEQMTFYDVWQRPESPVSQIREHVALGTKLAPAAVPRCADVRRLARVAGPNGMLAAVLRRNPLVYDLAASSAPAGWTADPNTAFAGAVLPSGAGHVTTAIAVPRPGRYELYLRESFRNGLEVLVDGQRIFSGREQFNWPGHYTPLGESDLQAGQHTVVIRYGGQDWRPGSGGPQRSFGPLVVGPSVGNLPVTYVDAKDAESLCGEELDWIEALS